MPAVDHTLEIAVAPATIIAAFFDPSSLAHWWRVERSVTTPRLLGVYAVEWAPTPFADEVLGALGGVLYGTVMDYRADREFLVAEVYWIPPEAEPIGPMALHVSCVAAPGGQTTRLRVLQTGGDESARWKRYYDVMGAGWTGSLAALKAFLESAESAGSTST
jgi:uncharacterized protein YndB with AHSA1/START domain